MTYYSDYYDIFESYFGDKIDFYFDLKHGIYLPRDEYIDYVKYVTMKRALANEGLRHFSENDLEQLIKRDISDIKKNDDLRGWTPTWYLQLDFKVWSNNINDIIKMFSKTCQGHYDCSSNILKFINTDDLLLAKLYCV